MVQVGRGMDWVLGFFVIVGSLYINGYFVPVPSTRRHQQIRQWKQILDLLHAMEFMAKDLSHGFQSAKTVVTSSHL